MNGDDEVQTRVCRACGEKYRYPVKHSPAQRFYCELCAQLPTTVRAVFERLTRRVVELERAASGRVAARKPHA
ncbi:MAG: hypothetical protein L6Q92_02605 [Phycisphaerae bacterium]|nr:hypothetical protein [Phycisphaerae bacterium]